MRTARAPICAAGTSTMQIGASDRRDGGENGETRRRRPWPVCRKCASRELDLDAIAPSYADDCRMSCTLLDPSSPSALRRFARTARSGALAGRLFKVSLPIPSERLAGTRST